MKVYARVILLMLMLLVARITHNTLVHPLKHLLDFSSELEMAALNDNYYNSDECRKGWLPSAKLKPLSPILLQAK